MDSAKPITFPNSLSTISEVVGHASFTDALPALVAEAIESRDVSPGSRKTYQRALRPFLAFWEAQGYPRPSRQLVLSFKRELETRGLSPFTLSAYLNAVRILFRFLEAEGLCPDVTRGLRGARKPRGHAKDHLTGAELSALLAAIPTDTPQGLRDYAMINLMARTGLRTIEIVRANVGDLATAGADKVLRVEGKGRSGHRDEKVLILEGAFQPLAAYLATRGNMEPEEPLFASQSDRNAGQRLSTRTVRRVVADAMKKAGIKTARLSAHSLRHSAATLAVSNGAPLMAVQAMLRHTDPKTTLIYVRNVQRFGPEAAERFISWGEEVETGTAAKAE